MRRALTICCLLMAAVTRLASAEWQITPMLGVTFRGNTTIVDVENATGAAHKEFGGAVTFLTRGIFGAEGLISMTPGFFQVDRPRSRGSDPLPSGLVTSSRTFALMGNVVVAAPRRYTEYFLRPFVSGGLGLLEASESDPVFNAHPRLFGFNVGGGAVGFITAHTGVRFELRYYANMHKGAPKGSAVAPVHLRYLVASVGLVFRTSTPQP